MSERSYEAIPFHATPARAGVVSEILRKISEHETVFSAYAARCVSERDTPCQTLSLEEMCPRCQSRMATVSRALTAPDARVWEVWEHTPDASRLVGVIHFSSVNPGIDATGHYVFFDEDLQSKNGVLREVLGWAFEDHPEAGWAALARLTIEIPSHAYILARHAQKRLGFGGPFSHRLENGKKLSVEGVKRSAVPWREGRSDLLILGVTREEWGAREEREETQPEPVHS